MTAGNNVVGYTDHGTKNTPFRWSRLELRRALYSQLAVGTT